MRAPLRYRDRTRERVHKIVVALAAKWMSTAGLPDIYVVSWRAMFMVFARTMPGCKERRKTETRRVTAENKRPMGTWAHKFGYTMVRMYFSCILSNDGFWGSLRGDQRTQEKSRFKEVYGNDLITFYSMWYNLLYTKRSQANVQAITHKSNFMCKHTKIINYQDSALPFR